MQATSFVLHDKKIRYMNQILFLQLNVTQIRIHNHLYLIFFEYFVLFGLWKISDGTHISGRYGL